ncbi:MAG: acyltransferase [Bermanella sp.]|nr:acyltransferase [Bermanella sp.]|tara:strand:- start:687 stop:1850 length:1164 start_codon:yes stop_codon:yes gene_type:complete
MSLASFDDIRAYHDHEVNAVLASLLEDGEFLQFVAQHQFPYLNRFLPRWTQKKIQSGLDQHFKRIDSIQTWQNQLTPHVEKLMKKTISEFKVSGLENLSKDQTYVFISNHRDIAMDPLLVNFALLKAGFNTSKVAIGDNLLGRQFVAKLMRLNKSFVVKRSVEGRREKLKAVQDLSDYIHHCVRSNQHVWIAQKEGRAKDGVDLTDTAVLKMLHMAGRKLGWEFNQSMAFLNVVPVSISYEWDPCDIDKAQERLTVEQNGRYEKSLDEDFLSIVKGLQGDKGRVALHFSEPLSLESNLAEQWSQAIDESIHRHYHLFENNHLALSLFESKTNDASSNVHLKGRDGKKIKGMWHKRFKSVPKGVLKNIEQYYAQPVLLKNKIEKQDAQ